MGFEIPITKAAEEFMKIRVNGVNLNYRIDGPENAPWVTMSNSLATTHRMWDAQMEAFTKQYRVLRYDKRGVGESTGSFLAAGLFEETGDARVALAALRSDEGCNGRVAVIGHSVGATIAMRLARSTPPPEAYVLLAGAAISGAEVMEWQSHRIATTLPAPARWMASRIERRQANDRDRLLASTGDTILLDREEMPARWFREYMAYDPKSDLGAIAGPVLAITGSKDIQVDAGDVDRMRLLVTAPFVGETPDNLTHLLRSDEHRPGIRRYAAQLRGPVDPMLVERVATWTAATLR